MYLLAQDKFESVTTCVNSGMSIRETMKHTWVAKQTVMNIKRGHAPNRDPYTLDVSKGSAKKRYLEAVANRNPPDADGNPTCIEDEFTSMVRSRRFFALGIEPREKPKDQTVDARCGNPKCYAPEHVYLRRLKSYKDSPWKAIARRIEELPLDGEIFLADIDRKSEAERAKLRCNIAVHTMAKFAIRSQPSGGVKIIRVGTYGSYLRGIEANHSDTHHPVLVQLAKKKNGPGPIFLGLLWGTWDKPKEEREERVARCSEKSCVFPRMDGASVCSTHWKWDSAIVSYPRQYKISSHEIYNKSSDDKTIDSPHALFHTGWIGEDKYNFLNTQTLKSGNFVSRSSAERQNDKWWKENVVDKGIEAPGVMVRKTRAELKAEMDAMIDHSLLTYSQYQSKKNIDTFWKVLKEPKQLHEDPFHPNSPRLKIGDGAAVSLRGKMRRGGGHGQGIRKKQRKRAAGWTSSRHNHDPQYFTRDTIREFEYQDFDESVFDNLQED